MNTFLIRVKRSSLQKAEKLHREGKLSIIYQNSKPFYLEVTEDDSAFQISIWPTNTGYEGRKDGWVLRASSLRSLMTSYTSLILEDMQIEEYSNYTYIVEVEDDENNSPLQMGHIQY